MPKRLLLDEIRRSRTPGLHDTVSDARRFSGFRARPGVDGSRPRASGLHACEKEPSIATDLPPEGEPFIETGDPTYPDIPPIPEEPTDSDPDPTYPEIMPSPIELSDEPEPSDTAWECTLPGVPQALARMRLPRAPRIPKDLTLPPQFEPPPPHTGQGRNRAEGTPPLAHAGGPVGFHRTRRRGWLLPAVVAAVAAPLVVVAWVGDNPWAATWIEATIAPASTPAEVKVSISTFPEDAEAFVDGRRFPTSRPVTRPADGALHELRVQARGYETITRSFRLDHNISMVFGLGKQTARAQSATTQATSTVPTAAPPSPQASKRTARITASTQRAPESTGARCLPPFELDENGLRIYKVECL